jgi:hypothetical protein
MFGSEFYIGFGIGMLISAGVAIWYSFGHDLKQTMKGWLQIRAEAKDIVKESY